MTTPEQPDVRRSDTGWPADPPLAAPALTTGSGASSPAHVDTAPVEVPEPVASPQPAPAPEPEPAPAPEPVAGREAGEQTHLPLAPSTNAAAKPGRASTWSVPVLALLLTTVLMAVAAGFVWYDVHQHNLAESARVSALDAARNDARILLSYDYRTLDKNFRDGRAITTGAFQQQYSDTTSKAVAPVATRSKAVVQANVVTAGVASASADRVVVILYVNQVTTTNLASGPKVDLSRVRMTLVQVSGHWKVSRIDAL